MQKRKKKTFTTPKSVPSRSSKPALLPLGRTGLVQFVLHLLGAALKFSNLGLQAFQFLSQGLDLFLLLLGGECLARSGLPGLSLAASKSGPGGSPVVLPAPARRPSL
jgi:hypothetical protein